MRNRDIENVFPPLPDEIPDPEASIEDSAGDISGPAARATLGEERLISPINRFWRFRSLRHGCYLVKYTPRLSRYHYDGTIRVERNGSNTTASGDLYLHRPFLWPYRRTISGVSRIATPAVSVWPISPDPNPANGIPIFARSRYRYYLRITQILEWITISNSFTLGFEMHRFNHSTHDWTLENSYTARMAWTTAPTGYPSSGDYLEGDVKNASGSVVGRLTMGWVSSYLRKATIEVDRYNASEHPANNGSGTDWQDVFDQVGWQINAYESDTNLVEPSGSSWSDAELHAKMLARRDSANLDTEWRYHLLCVRNLDSTSRGIMYDAYATDSNNVPREGAAISSHWVIPNQPKWGTVQGLRFGAASAPYFRTAVHEIGHALGLRHNTNDNGFMNTTGVIAGSSGTFPGNIQWSFNTEDARKLRHMPDSWVRPGEIPWAPGYSDPISPLDAIDAEGLDLKVTPLNDSVPLGAPVRVKLELCNNTDMVLPVPDSLSLKSEHVTGTVHGPAGDQRTFRSLVRCIDEDEGDILEPKESKSHDITLLRGAQGALFSAPGVYQVEVDVHWQIDGIPVKSSTKTSVMVTPAQDLDHSAAALKVLSEPDALLTLALGGDHLENGISAIQAALDNPVLRPHYSVIEAKRIGRRFGQRAGDADKAMKLIDKYTVMTDTEKGHLDELKSAAPKAKRRERKKVAEAV